MGHNINQVSFIIGQFNQLIKNFGQRKEQIDYFKEQCSGLVNIGQIKQDDLKFVYKLIGIDKSSNINWNESTNRVNTFIYAMNYMVSCELDIQRAKLLVQLMQSNKIDNNIAELIDELYDNKIFGNTPDISSMPESGFGTLKSDRSLKKQRNKQLDSKTTVERVVEAKRLASKSSRNAEKAVLDELANAGYGDIVVRIVRDIEAGNDRMIRIKNYGACCSCDPKYYNIKIKDLINLSLRYPSTYKSSLISSIKNGEFCIVAGIHGYELASAERTLDWAQQDRRDLLSVIEILIDANIEIQKR